MTTDLPKKMFLHVYILSVRNTGLYDDIGSPQSGSERVQHLLGSIVAKGNTVQISFSFLARGSKCLPGQK